jgi:hypothetical protein
MSRKLKLMTLEELDERLDQGKTYRLEGRKVDWHGACVGTIVKRGDTFAVRIRLACANGCGRRFTLHVRSGLHNGAFVYTCDRNGKIDGGNLRVQVVRCAAKNQQDCKGRDA